MSVLVGKEAPVFTSQAVLASGEMTDDFDLGKFIAGKYAAIFFYPLDFTFVCPSEIIAFANRTETLNALGCEVVAVSTDSHYTHSAWRKTPVEQGGIGAVPFPLVADMTKDIANAYGILSGPGNSYYPPGVAMRATFVIDQQGVVRHQVVNDEPLGRSVDEVIRIVDAMQFFEANGQVCPAGWSKGDPGMVNTSRGVATYMTEHAAAL
jgi:peroxiredoxin (alkyl hydroperoxide reductase subunit C)